MLFPNSKSRKRNIAAILLTVILATAVLNFLLWPVKTAQATVPVSDPPLENTLITMAATDKAYQGTNIAKILEQIGISKETLDTIKTASDTAKSSLNTLGYINGVLNDTLNNALLKQSIATAAFLFLRELLGLMTDQINNWINGGKTPQFVGDWKAFLQNAANRAGGKFVDTYLGAGFLCSHFDLSLKVALANNPPFAEAGRCTISDMVSNIDDFYNNFSNGGWQAWVAINQPNNNIYGAYLMASQQKYIEMETAAEAAKSEAIAGNGFLGTRDANGQITVPGSVLGAQLNKQIDSSRQMIQDEIVALIPQMGPVGEIILPYLQSIANTLINKLVKTGLRAAGVNTPP